MPYATQACADKLRMEMEDYGFPPVFPDEVDVVQPVESSEPKLIDKSKGKKVQNDEFCHVYWLILEFLFELG